MTTQPNDDGTSALSPDGAFTLLGNATRMGILRALWEAYDPYAADNAVPFSELYDRVGIDDTGNFNYHLGRLIDHFVRRTDGGYELATPGFAIVRAVIAGTATENPILDPAVVDATCGRCDSPVEITYEDGTVWARCTECEGYWPQRDGRIFGFGLPPEGLRNRESDEIFDATIAYSIRRFETMSDGVCPACGGTVDASLAACEDHEVGYDLCDACGFYFLGILTFVCESCKFAWRSPSWAPVHRHPAVVSFYYERGIEHASVSWEAICRSFEWREELLATDPTRLRITVPHRGDELRVVLDETGTVVEVDR
ncbi:winged helix-turn-helix domain-containing protein [Halomarina pelagica]|uniref:winged helix-turn-helix domain-containing protein n=1 Tax=Halomarina pelagica TaxID=2961599 RepID=UPI0020C3D347|nr:helix-turn-helix domain-containing protein [Halomarina sp. BND7]